MSKRFDRANGALRRLLTIAMVLVFLVGLAPVARAESDVPNASPDAGWATSVIINSPTTAKPVYLNPNRGPFTVDFAAGGTGNGRVWARVGFTALGWGDDPVWSGGTPVTFPYAEKRPIQAGCVEGTYDVSAWAQGQSQTIWLSATQANAAVVDCTNPVVPANPLIAPNGGEPLSLGSYFNVTWDPSQIRDANLGPNPISLDLQCVIGGAPINAMLADGLPNTGSYAWLVGGAVGACRMILRATDLAGNQQQGMSLNTFNISGLDPTAPAVTLLTPPGATAPGWTWLRGIPYNFTANASDPQSGIKTVAFEVSQDGGATWPFVNVANTGPSPSFGFVWDLGPAGGLPQYDELLVRATATNGLDAFTRSAVNRRIKIDRTAPIPGPVLFPDMGAGGQLAGTQRLRAISGDADMPAGSGVGKVVFQYSLDGQNWTSLPGAYWQNPNNPADFYWQASWDTRGVVPVGTEGNVWLRESTTDVAGNGAVTAPVQQHVDNKQPVVAQPFLLIPNGGQVWQLGLPNNITWDPAKATDAAQLAASSVAPDAFGATPVTLFYSADGGASWTQFATNLPNNGAYLWADNAGLLPGANYKVKIEVRDLAGNTASDISDAPFTLWNNDDSLPTVAVITAVAPLTNGVAKGTVNVTGQGLDEQSGIQAIRFQVHTRTWTAANAWSGWTGWSDLGAAPSLTYNYATKRWSGVVPWNTGAFSGEAELRAIAKNGVGMEFVGGAFGIPVDNSAPGLTWDAGYDAQCVANGQAFPIGVQAVEPPPGNVVEVKFEYSINGGARWLEIARVLGAPFVAFWDTTVTLDTSTPPRVIPMPDGPAILRATARNQAGLTTQITNRFIYIKNNAAVSPQVTCLVKGWNLYSTPLVLNDANMAPIATVLAGPVANGTLSQVRTFVWEGAPQELVSKAWFPAIGGDIEFIKDGQGYWFNMSAPDVLAVSGTLKPGPLFPPRSYSVLAGWNIIGFTSVNPRLAHEVAGALNYPGYLDPQVYPTVSAIYGYDRATQMYVVPAGTMLNPNEGYWLAVNANGTIFP